jgi:hypothetical protein
VSFGFYDAGPIRQLATNLFYGWGYNFYRAENQLRADDQLVRSKAAWLLGLAKASVEAAEAAYRLEFLPPPTRQKPFPDAAAVAGAQRLERLARDIGALELIIQQQPVPENDRMTERYRQEKATLEALIDRDEQLVGRCELLRTLVESKSAAAVLEAAPALEEGLGAIRASLQNRQAALFGRIP